MRTVSLEEFYEEASAFTGKELQHLLPPGISGEIGHFNIFDTADVRKKICETGRMPYNRRAYYKISLIRGRNRAEYADKIIDIEKSALLFATPRVPYNWVPLDEDQGGSFCVFTADFLAKAAGGIKPDDLPIFRAGAVPVFMLTDGEAQQLAAIFAKINAEIRSDYAFKYDLIRNYVMELIHFGQKLQPLPATRSAQNAPARVSGLFIELLERQFPLETPHQQVGLRTAADFASALSVHVNHLNKVLRETTGKTTTAHISARILLEAKILLRQTDWNVAEIAASLGFGEIAHFSNFFRKHASITPVAFRAAESS
jgi:AraC family transcriptional regulator, transcriptional activator of pobA